MNTVQSRRSFSHLVILAILLLTLATLACSVLEPVLETYGEFLATVTSEAQQEYLAGMADLILPNVGTLAMGEPADLTQGWTYEGSCRRNWRFLLYLAERKFSYAEERICGDRTDPNLSEATIETREYWISHTLEQPEIFHYPVTPKGYLVAPILYELDTFPYPSYPGEQVQNSQELENQYLIGIITLNGLDVQASFCISRERGYSNSDLPDEGTIQQMWDDRGLSCFPKYGDLQVMP